MGYVGNKPAQTTIPADDSVTTAMVQDDAVTADKVANSINTEITANTAKVTNATHTGDVTGATALTIASGAVDLAMLSATGTASSSTFLRGDNAWAAAGGTNTPAFEAYPTDYLTSHAGNTWVKFDMGTEVFDTDGCFDSSTNYRFTPTTAGKYFCYAQVTYNGITDGVRILSAFYKNGSIDSITRTSMVSAGANEGSTSCRYIFDMNGSTDYIEFYGRRDGSTSRYYLNHGTYFGAYRILT